jgi:hypothetical protein
MLTYTSRHRRINGRTDIWPQKGRPGFGRALELHVGGAVRLTPQMRRPGSYRLLAEQWRDTRPATAATLLPELFPVAAACAVLICRSCTAGGTLAAVARWWGRLADRREPGARLYLEQLQLHFIARDDEFGPHGHFREQRLWDLIEARHCTSAEHGSPDCSARFWPKPGYPELKRLTRLRDSIAERALAACQHDRRRWLQSVSDAAILDAHVALPAVGADKVFLASWLHGLPQPPPGFALVELDWAGIKLLL